MQRYPLNVCRISQFYFYWELVVHVYHSRPKLSLWACKDLKVRVNSLNWHRFTTRSQCNCLRIGVMCARGGVCNFAIAYNTRCGIMRQLKPVNGVQWYTNKNTITVIQPRNHMSGFRLRRIL